MDATQKMNSKIETRMNRANLRFSELAQVHFAFLPAQGFTCVRSDSTFVRFESSSLFINIYHDFLSFEIDVEIGRLGNGNDEKQPYPMSALLEAAGVPTAEKYRSYATRTPDGVDEGLTKLAKLFSDYVSQNIQNAELFRVLKEQRQARIHEFAQEVKFRQMRQKLDIMWHAKDYAGVVKLLFPLRDVLTPIELHKLKYAEKYAERYMVPR
jgi:hypothetical protein